MITGDLVRAMNEHYGQLLLEAARVDGLPIELEQLRQAVEAVNRKVDFDIDPSDFRAALLAAAAQADHG
jgi:hypothetical protein